MSFRTPQQLADQLNSLRAQAVNIVEGSISGAANPGGSITFTYRNPIDGQSYTATGTAWNQCSPSKVSALRLSDGTWIVIGAHEAAPIREAIHTDRRASPKPSPQKGGVIMWLDSNWRTEIFQNEPGSTITPELRLNNAKVFARFAQFFLQRGQKQLYVWVGDQRLYEQEGFEFALTAPFTTELQNRGISVREVAEIRDANGLFFLPLMKTTARLTINEFKHLRSLAPRYGLLIEGEWLSWAGDSYNDPLLRGLNIRSEIKTVQGRETPRTYQSQNKAIFRGTIEGNAYAKFLGLREEENLASTASGDVVFAYFKASR